MTPALRPLVIAVVALLVLPAALHAAAILKPTNLRCEYRVDPLGIGTPKPRLSWLLVSDKPAERGQKQSAYHILVAGSRELLDQDKGELWDLGRQRGDSTAQIEYVGAPLTSGQQVWWKVRVWNKDGEESPWSEPATWSMALLDEEEFKAKWIGFDEPAAVEGSEPEEAAITLEGLKWVWTDEGDATADPTKNAPEGERFFAKKISLPEDAKVRKALFLCSVDDHLDLIVNGKGAGEGASFQAAHLLDVTTLLQPGENVLAIKARNGQGPAGVIGRMMVWLEGPAQPAEPITVNVDKTWKFTKEKPEEWPDGKLEIEKWGDVKEFADLGAEPWKTPQKNALELPPPPYLRKSFALDKPIKRAIVRASALGLYELHINGARVGNDFFTPGWTDYKKRLYYNTYDVTKQLHEGNNVIGAILGDGWYAGYFTWGRRRAIYGKDPRFFAQLDIEFADGSKKTVITDKSWKCTYGPWRAADLLQGAIYDANQELGDWSVASFDDSSWKEPVVADAPRIAFEPYPGEPIRAQEEIAAKNITEPQPGVYVFDLGQNMVGWVRLKLKADKGTRITLRHAEMLTGDGMLYTIALRSARATDIYIAKGGGEEVFEPKFTSHGFRYVELTGVKEKPSLDAITGIVVHNEMPRTGHFECSNELVNQLFHNIIWGQKGNYLEVPTDCPQRDERMGWTGDAQVFIPTAAYNFDVASFFTKWLVDLIQDAQDAEGRFADVAPDVTGGYGNTAWGDAGIICPYVIYMRYGDTRIIEQHWPNMVRYIDWLQKTAKDHIRGQGAYGDWVNLGGGAKAEVIGTAYYQYVVRLMSEMATAIGKKDEATKYATLADDIKKAFIANFVSEDGAIKESSQTGYALAFTLGLIPPDRRAAAAEKLIAEIEKFNWHLASGFVGTVRLLPALTIAGRNDVAYQLFLNETFPSWLYQVKLGATTMWERWDGWTPEKGFQDPGMNSFNHYAFGSVGNWMYNTITGIDPDAPGFKRVTFKPQPDSRLTFATAKYDSIRGTIESAWKRDGEVMKFNFTVPPNTIANAHIPAPSQEKITESGKPLAEAEGVKFLFTEGGAQVYRLQSGTYEFSVK